MNEQEQKFYEYDSNTTLVKVKSFSLPSVSKVYTNSNTTLVKVK